MNAPCFPLMNILTSRGQHFSLTFQGRVDFISKEAIPFFSCVSQSAALRHNTAPVPAPQRTSWETQFSLLSCHFPSCPPLAPHLMPLLIASVGAQPMVSTQSVQRYCLLSRNHPESASPRTWTELCPRLFRSSATRSTFSRTPVPPALNNTHIHTVTI